MGIVGGWESIADHICSFCWMLMSGGNTDFVVGYAGEVSDLRFFTKNMDALCSVKELFYCFVSIDPLE